jgi:hypothetical protein
MPAVLVIAAAPACANLCGSWKLDAAASDSAAAVVDQAMQTYKPPKDRRRHLSAGSTVESMTKAADEEAIGPIFKRPGGDELRRELLQSLIQPQALTIAAKNGDVVIARDGGTPQALSIDQPYARVDDFGTAKIRYQWQQGQLELTENYDRRRRYSRAYQFDKKQGALILAQWIKRPGLATVTVNSVYRKSP